MTKLKCLMIVNSKALVKAEYKTIFRGITRWINLLEEVELLQYQNKCILK